MVGTKTGGVRGMSFAVAGGGETKLGLRTDVPRGGTAPPLDCVDRR